MTRHRENVDLYYKKSDFKSFKELANSASKYIQKDSLVDYRNIENINRSRVYEYKEMLLETSSLLKDINIGEASWSDYRKLKESSNSLGKEILQNYDSHKLYLKQIGITKEKLEISVGVQQRPLTNVELNAKSTVELYAKTSLETHALYEKMKKETFNITQHGDYQKYSEIRDSRDELAGKILSNYPIHREFVGQLSKEYGISKKGMENPVKYADRTKGESKMLEKPEMTNMSASDDFFKKLDAAKDDQIAKYPYEGSTVADYMILDKRAHCYDELFTQHKEEHGYAPYISKTMVMAHAYEHNLKMEFYDDSTSHEYASMLVQRSLDAKNLKEPTLAILEDSIKQALCFKALYESNNVGELTSEKTKELHLKAAVLSEHITKENLHVLDN
ncbi:hypothetical protein FACS1894122_14950 [Alphaproteobacteria bacterium]|nr:hypothetical protein FACS1894122_14950 [Alphaproteobacteria bacterium]